MVSGDTGVASGNTPTHVGKTHGSYKQRRVVEKHPHARGEDRDGIIVYLPLAETPPRTWGRRVHVRIVAVRRGNTPTHVGKTRKNRNRKNRSQKHPHARGEDRGRARQYRSVQETPPRTWGRRVGTSSIVIRPGNTPTHVGKTLHRRQALSGNRKHPHARGEDRMYAAGESCRSRNTPTHVGKTSGGVQEVGVDQKHPHARGEDAENGDCSRQGVETPPRTWGRHLEFISFFPSYFQ